MLAGYDSPDDGTTDAWIIRLDDAGEMVCERRYGSGHGHASAIVQTADGGYALTGWLDLESGSEALWILKLDENGEL